MLAHGIGECHADQCRIGIGTGPAFDWIDADSYHARPRAA